MAPWTCSGDSRATNAFFSKYLEVHSCGWIAVDERQGTMLVSLWGWGNFLKPSLDVLGNVDWAKQGEHSCWSLRCWVFTNSWFWMNTPRMAQAAYSFLLSKFQRWPSLLGGTAMKYEVFLSINSEVLWCHARPLVAICALLKNSPLVLFLLFYFISAAPGAPKKMNVSVKDLTVCYDSHQSTEPCSHK